jgi:ubiquinone/menaquinone biosynthesis C-methylase UbiE
MTINEAKDLIAPATIAADSSQQWVDLGCGSGTFSYALAAILPKGSNIICVDIGTQHIEPVYNNNSLQFKKADIQQVSFAPGSLSGILMANSLHYVKDQRSFIERIGKFLAANASYIIVEYDTDIANQWVPYPLSFNTLNKLFDKYDTVRKLNERPSVYGRANLYACQVSG